MKRLASTILCSAVLLGGSAGADDWADDEGSAFEKGQFTLGFGASVADFGVHAIGEYAVHQAISVGGAAGYTRYGFGGWDYNQLPIAVRAAFHPFNLEVIADKIPVRDRLDVYVGVASGFRIDAGSDGDGLEPDYTPGFFVRELIGARWYFSKTLAVYVEEGTGFGVVNGGVVFKF